MSDIDAQDFLAPGAGTIFIIDDDPGIRDTLVRMLGLSSYNVVALDGVQESIDRLIQEECPVLIIDLALGRTDAVEVLGRLERADSSCDVILISGHSLETRQRVAGIARNMGHAVLGTLAKPFRRHDLLEILSTRPDRRSAGRVASGAPQAGVPLREALAAGWLEFWFQPQIDLRLGRICGLEALARIRHPQLGIITPASFIGNASAEEKRALTHAAIDAAAKIGEKLRGKNLGISINVFGALLAEEDLMRQLIETRNRLGDEVPITIEVTENDVGDNVAAETFSTRAMLYGLQVSIDDFGTAYATFARLRTFSFSELKLDRAIVSAVATDPRAYSICRASVELAHACDATAVAEGVETAEDLALVCSLGFDLAQGFLFARPMPQDELLRLLGDDNEQRRIRDLVRVAKLAKGGQPASVAGSDRETENVPSVRSNGDGERRHVLLVEDDPFIADMICSLWPTDDVRFSRAASLQAALRMLREPPASGFDAVILDLELPDGCGLTILPNIREMTAAAIVIISGAGTSDSRADAIDAGVADYIMKPFSVRELRARLERSMATENPPMSPT